PDVTLQVLASAGARCGDGAPQKILKQCPAERFCALPGGELCIYGVEQIPQMTQIRPADLAGVVCPPGKAAAAPGLAWGEGGALGVSFALGLAVGAAALGRRWR